MITKTGIRLYALFMTMVAMTLVVTACTTTQVVSATTTTAQAYLLEAQFDEAAGTLTALPLSESERAVIDTAIGSVRSVLDRYDSVESAVIDLPLARYRIDQLRGAFQMAQSGYGAYLSRTGQEPDPGLKYYESIAVASHNTLTEYLDSLDTQSTVPSGFGSEQVMLMVRVLAAVASKGAI